MVPKHIYYVVVGSLHHVTKYFWWGGGGIEIEQLHRGDRNRRNSKINTLPPLATITNLSYPPILRQESERGVIVVVGVVKYNGDGMITFPNGTSLGNQMFP